MPASPRREARRKAGFKRQCDLAEKLGVATETICRYETGALTTPKWYDDYIRLLGMERKQLDLSG